MATSATSTIDIEAARRQPWLRETLNGATSVGVSEGDMYTAATAGVGRGLRTVVSSSASCSPVAGRSSGCLARQRRRRFSKAGEMAGLIDRGDGG